MSKAINVKVFAVRPPEAACLKCSYGKISTKRNNFLNIFVKYRKHLKRQVSDAQIEASKHGIIRSLCNATV